MRGLDGLRGIAVLLVILFHAQSLLGTGSYELPIVAGGWLGVDIFFVISGFLITGILRDTRNHPRYWKTFVLRRALRILPLYFFILAIFILPRVAAGIFEGPPYWVYPLFVSNFWVATTATNIALAVTWSLSIEEQFYFVWPLVVRYADRRRLATVCMTLVLVAPIARFVLHDPTNEISYMWTVCRMDALAWGALAWIAWELRARSWCEWAARLTPAGVVVWIAIIGVGGDMRSSRFFAVVGSTLFPFIIAAMVLGLASGGLPTWVRALEWRPLVHLGQVSFGAYLIHGPVINVVEPILKGRPIVAMLAVTAITWGAATLLWRVIESPALAKKDQIAPY